MTEHDPARSNRTPSTHSTAPATSPLPAPAGWRTWFTREQLSRLAARLKLNRVQTIPGLAWILAAAAIAVIIQGVGLANLIAVHDEQQTWSATTAHRQTMLDDLAGIERQQRDAKEQLHLLKGQIDHESGRLAELQGELKLTQTLRDDAQKSQAAAAAEAARLKDTNESNSVTLRELTVQLETTRSGVAQLLTQRDKLAAEVAASKKALDDQLADVAKASEHARQLDAQAGATLEAIRKSREAQLKAQTQLDELSAAIARGNADREVADTRLKAANDQLKIAQSDIESFNKQLAAARIELAASRKAGDEQTATRAETEAAIASLKEKLEKAGKSLAEKQGAAAAQESIIAAAQQRHDALNQRVANLTAELKPLEEQRLALEADAAGKRREIEALRERLDAARADLKSLPPAPSPSPSPAPKPADDPKNKPAPAPKVSPPAPAAEGPPRKPADTPASDKADINK